MTDNRKKVVIIGGGTAGLTIANNLQDCFNVTVIEKSKYKRYPIWYKIPLFIGLLFNSEKTKYISKRDYVLSSGRRIPFFESNLLGGASVMNGCVHMLGSKLQWNSILKEFNSNYNDLLKSYNNLYSLKTKDQNKISLSMACQNNVDAAFIEALKVQGIPFGDMNYSNEEACGPILNTIKKYFRTSVLTLIAKRRFKQVLNENVEGILFNDDGEVTGVRTLFREFHSDYVILSGGVVGTCDLLLREKSRTNKAGDFLINLNIGRNIQDHTNLRINVLTSKSIDSLNEISDSFFKKISLVFKHFSGRSTLMKGTGATTAAHLDLDKDGVIDTRIQIVQFSETGRAGSDGKLFSSSKPGFSISITAINPKSKGIIKLDGANNIVDPMYLSSKKDVELLKLALKFCLSLLKSEPLNSLILKIEKEEEMISNPENYIINNVFSGYHLIGGMHGMINSDFEVYNTKGLYVCDASVFDKYAASNIHSSVVLIADIFAKKFLANNSV
jgi:choline dehydrogenase-like flavoprotein